MPVRSQFGSALVGALIAAMLNLAAVAYWGGQIGQHLADIERRVVRIETWIDSGGKVK